MGRGIAGRAALAAGGAGILSIDMTRCARIEGHRDPVVRLALMRPRGGAGTVTDVTGTFPIVVTGGASKNVAWTPPAYTYATNPERDSPIAITNAFAAIIAANITPEVSGKVTTRVAGVVENADSAATHFFSLEISTGLGVALAPDAISVPPSIGGVPGRASFSAIVALDQAPTNPVTFAPLGVLANISVAAKADVNGELTIITESIQVESQERFV